MNEEKRRKMKLKRLDKTLPGSGAFVARTQPEKGNEARRGKQGKTATCHVLDGNRDTRTIEHSKCKQMVQTEFTVIKSIPTCMVHITGKIK